MTTRRTDWIPWAVLGGLGLLGVAVLAVPTARRALLLPEVRMPNPPESFTPTGPRQTEYRTPAEARAALGELGRYFSWDESGVWPRNGAPIPHQVALAMVETARTYLDVLRAAHGPIVVTSWYRPRDYNLTVTGASDTSMHPTGYAVDFYFRNHRNGFKGAEDVASTLAARNVPWDQVIGYETGTHRMHLGARYHDGGYRMLVQQHRPGRAGTDYPVVARYRSGGGGIALA